MEQECLVSFTIEVYRRIRDDYAHRTERWSERARDMVAEAIVVAHNEEARPAETAFHIVTKYAANYQD